MHSKIKPMLVLAIFDAIFIALMALYIFAQLMPQSILSEIVLWFLIINIIVLNLKKVYYNYKNIYLLFESIIMANVFATIPLFLLKLNLTTIVIAAVFALFEFIALLFVRFLVFLSSKIKRKPRNVLIVGAGQDGKLIAEEIQARPNIGLKVVGFLDDNMNTIEDEDSTIPILGLTCDSEAVIKDNNVKIVIVSVKSRMDSNILTDLIKGIPLGVKVWRMPKFYEELTHKYLISKMTVNWLFYACVKKKALLYAYLKRFCDVISSILILLITIPLSLIAIIGIKLSDLGPIFYTQTRIGKFGKPFEMLKFRTMYQDKVENNFDDDLNEVTADDKRIIPFCKWIRKFHIDEIPQMINVLRGDMSIVGPRPVREEVYYKNCEKIPFWECRNWVRPGWCGWQQLKEVNPTSEDRLAYDLYYMRHRNLVWEFLILLRFKFKILCGKG